MKSTSLLAGFALGTLAVFGAVFVFVKVTNAHVLTNGTLGESSWRVSDTTWAQPNIALSPDARYVAALCPVPNSDTFLVEHSTHVVSAAQQELRVWRVSDKTEVARQSVRYGGPVAWTLRGTDIAVGNSVWKWKSEKLAPTSVMVTGVPRTAALCQSVNGDLAVSQSLDDLTSLKATQISTHGPIKLFPHVVRRLLDLPPNGDTAPYLDSSRMIVSNAPYKGAANIILAHENMVAGLPFGSSLHCVQVASWDLVSGRKLWQWQGSYRYSVPNLIWSPSGRQVAVVGTISPDAETLAQHPDAQVKELSEDHLGDQGIQILDATSGKPLYSFNALGFGGSLSLETARWSQGATGNVFVLDDWTWIPHQGAPFERQHLLRLFDSGPVKQYDVTGIWPLELSKDDPVESWSVSDDGEVLALANGRDGLRVFQTLGLVPGTPRVKPKQVSTPTTQ